MYTKLSKSFTQLPTLARDVSIEELEQFLVEADTHYADGTDILDDVLYDYLCDVYEERTNIKRAVANLPKDEARLVSSPCHMGSLNKLKHGKGEVDKWKQKWRAPYILMPKLDGNSALYWNNTLITNARRDRNKCQDISNLIPFLNLPKFDGIARGELIFKSSVFKQFTEYKSARSAVAGLTRHANSNLELRDNYKELAQSLDFVVYELVEPVLRTPIEQLEILSNAGFLVVDHQLENDVDDELLSQLHDAYLERLEYDIDGVVLYSNFSYERVESGTPGYAQAYKKPLDALTATVRVVDIEWNVSRHSYAKPTVIFGPVTIQGMECRRANGYNAKFICDNYIGPGAIINIIRGGGMISKIVDVIEKAPQPQMPHFDYEWNETHVDILATFEERQATIRQLHFFLATIKAKSIGLETVEKLYDRGFTTPEALLRLKSRDIEDLGVKMPYNIERSIREAIATVTLPTLMAASGCFARSIGIKRLEAILSAEPNILNNDDVNDLERKIAQITGFGPATTPIAARGILQFKTLFEKIADLVKIEQKAPPSQVFTSNHFEGKSVCLTGFRDEYISQFVIGSGGKIQSAVNSRTSLVVIKDEDCTNTKIEKARQMGITTITRAQFVAQWLDQNN